MKRVTIFALRRGHEQASQTVPVTAIVANSFSRRFLSEMSLWKKVLKTQGAEDAGWDWSAFLAQFKALQREGFGSYEYFLLRFDGKIQSAMILRSAGYTSPVSGNPMVYVEYIATAPWNRPAGKTPRVFSGCGTALLELAGERSKDLGFQGRMGLHSLPASRDFYRRAGLKDHGPDPHEGGLHYFELND